MSSSSFPSPSRAVRSLVWPQPAAAAPSRRNPGLGMSRRLRLEVGTVCCTAAGPDGEGTLIALLYAFELAGIAVVGI